MSEDKDIDVLKIFLETKHITIVRTCAMSMPKDERDLEIRHMIFDSMRVCETSDETTIKIHTDVPPEWDMVLTEKMPDGVEMIYEVHLQKNGKTLYDYCTVVLPEDKPSFEGYVKITLH